MNIEERLGPISKSWSYLDPSDFEYVGNKFHNYVVALYMLSDVVLAFSQARYLLIESAKQCDDNYKLMLFKRSTILQSSLMRYALCVDLSWQAIWFMYAVENDVQLIDDVNYYEKNLKGCTFKNIKDSLQKSTLLSANEVLSHLETYRNKKLWKEIDDAYNYIKHRGSFNITGVSFNDSKMNVSINGVIPNRLTRREFEVKEWTEKLVEYNKDFSSYFDKLIDFVLAEVDKKSPSNSNEFLTNLNEMFNTKCTKS